MRLSLSRSVRPRRIALFNRLWAGCFTKEYGATVNVRS